MKLLEEWADFILFVCCMIALVILLYSVNASAASCTTMDVLPSHVIGNYDGDTFTLSLGALGVATVRVEGVDTPERTKKQPKWEEAKRFTEQWLAQGPFTLKTCFILTLGRVVGSPYRNGRTLAQALIAAGLTK